MRKKDVPEALTLSGFKDGFSLTTLPFIAKSGERYGLKSGTLMFRSYSDLVAEKVWNDEDYLYHVLNLWHHCFPKNYQITR